MLGNGGIVCVVGVPTAAEIVNVCMELQMNRGNDVFGIVSVSRGKFHEDKKFLRAGRSFNGYPFGEELPGRTAIGFNADIAGNEFLKPEDALPMTSSSSRFGTLAIAKCGSIGRDIRKDLERRGAVFQSDSECSDVLYGLTTSLEKDIEHAVADTLRKIPFAYSLVILTKDKLFAARDRAGLQPLSIGRLDGGYLICSEDSIFDQYPNMLHDRAIRAGEVVVFTHREPEFKSIQYCEPAECFCIFEGLYFGNPRSHYKQCFHEDFREQLGKKLVQENSPKINGDFILPILNSGKNQSIGMQKASGLPYEEYLLPNEYRKRLVRSKPDSSNPDEAVRASFQKFNLRENKISGKEVIVVDGALTRKNDMRIINERLRMAGAKRIVTCITAPPVNNKCPFGLLNISAQEATATSLERIKSEIWTDEICFLSPAGLLKVVAETYGAGVCTGCLLGGKYPG